MRVSGTWSRWAAGHYLSSTRLARETDAWRHVAVVYDADSRRVTCWVDYHLARSIAVSEPPIWDPGPFFIGGNERWTMTGKIDEVRITRGALGPAEFLRARDDAIAGVTFVSDHRIVPRDAGCFDAKENFGAAGDGKTDDTMALNAAFTQLADRVP